MCKHILEIVEGRFETKLSRDERRARNVKINKTDIFFLLQGPVFVALGGAINVVDDRENRAASLLGFHLCG